MRKYKYKVVKAKSRASAMLSWNSPFSIKYIPLQNAVAKEGTLGIFVFNTRFEAEQWAEAWGTYSTGCEAIKLIVLKVLPIGRGKTAKMISPDVTSKGLRGFYNDVDPLYILGRSMENTMVYPGVFVVE